MQLSMTTDYVTYLGDPRPYLGRIATAGFTHIHWCHQWNTDYLYSDQEVGLVGNCLGELGLELLDLHASGGVKRDWGSSRGAEESANLELIRNRIRMTAGLGGGAIVLHLPPTPDDGRDLDDWRSSLRRSLDQLEPLAVGARVRIAIENMTDDDFEEIDLLLESYPPEFLGLCYDSGHGNVGQDGLDHLERRQHRLVSVHIHDNDGSRDQHSLPFTGTVDWSRLARIMAGSSYTGPVSLEANMRGESIEESLYLQQALAAGSNLTRMIAAERAGEV